MSERKTVLRKALYGSHIVDHLDNARKHLFP